MLAPAHHREVVMVRIVAGIASGALAAAVAIVVSACALLALHPPAAGADASLRAAGDHLRTAPAAALACLVAGVGLGAFAGGWVAAAIGRG